MRKSLRDLIQKTIVFEYELPHSGKSIARTVYSTENDHCYGTNADSSFSEIIYNALIEYAFNENELNGADYTALLARALQTRIRYESGKPIEEQIKYGFFGEVILNCLLLLRHKTTPLISKGYFFTPVDNQEPKGYDSYHLVEQDDKLELWFGESKFHASYAGGVKDVLDKIDSSLSDAYLSRNLISLPDHANNFNIKNSKLEQVLDAWKKKPDIKIIEEAKKYNAKLVYPVLLLFDENKSGFDETIKSVIRTINQYKPKKSINLSVDVSIFFMLVTVKNTNSIKRDVLEWIKVNKPLMP